MGMVELEADLPSAAKCGEFGLELQLGARTRPSSNNTAQTRTHRESPLSRGTGNERVLTLVHFEAVRKRNTGV